MVQCPNEFGIYSAMIELKMPSHLLKINGGYYTEKVSCSIDLCLVDEIKCLWSKGVVTLGCCCGHGINKGMINVAEKSVDTMLHLGYMLLDTEGKFYPNTFLPKSKHLTIKQ